MSILRELAEAVNKDPALYVRLECGCWANKTCFRPCAWHRVEFREDLAELTEGEPEHEDDGSCCDPS